MPSFISNFKERLRLPRLFFRKPSRAEQIHGGPPLEFERPIPPIQWRGITVVVVLVVIAATTGWELYVRSIGYGPTLNDNEDMWTLRRRAVAPESLVIIGDSRAWFDVDLDEYERGLGKRPVQLAMPGSCGYPVLADLAKDESFHGTIICSVVPRLFFAPPGTPPMERGEKAVKRFYSQTPAQRASQYLAFPLEEHVAFLKQDDLSLEELLKKLPIPNRPGALVPPRLPPYFQTVDRERRARMWEECARPGSELAQRIQQIWIRLFTPPPPPTYIPKEQFMAKIGEAIGGRFRDTAAAVEKSRARGGKIVFVRFPHSGGLKELEDRDTPRGKTWDPLLKTTGAPGIYYSDFPELSGFTCPEWSHLSAGDSVEFSKRLIPHLRAALKM
jgi:transposase